MIHKIKAPDGQIYQINAPENTTKEQAMAWFINEYNAGRAKKPKQAEVTQPVQPPNVEEKINPSLLDRAKNLAIGSTMGLGDAGAGALQIGSRIPATLSRGIGAGLDAVGAENLGQSFTQGAKDLTEFTDNWVKRREDSYQDATPGSYEAGAGRFAGNVIPMIYGGTALNTTRLAKLPTWAKNVGGGSTQGLLAPVTNAKDSFAQQKGFQTLLGGGLGGAIPAATTTGKKVFGNLYSPQLRMLVNEKIYPTLGQTMGGIVKKGEDALTSVPLLGHAIQRARNQVNEEFNTAVINRALRPIGEKLPDNALSGRKALNYADNVIGKRYNKVLDDIDSVKVDNEFFNSIDNNINDQYFPDEINKRIYKIVNEKLKNKIGKDGTITGKLLKEVESDMNKLASRFKVSESSDERSLGYALDDVKQQLRKLILRQKPTQAADLKNINRTYAMLMRPQRAMASVAPEDGVFNPSQLYSSVKALDTSKNKKAFAKGIALGQDFAESGKKILSNKLPNSGTVDRALTFGGVLGSGYGLAINPAATATVVGTGMGLGSIPYLARKTTAKTLNKIPGLLDLSQKSFVYTNPTITQTGLLSTR